MSKHTQASLNALPRKEHVVEIAEELGVDTEGTRDEIEARILAHQAAQEESSDAPEEPTSETPSASTTEEEESEEEEPEGERAREDDGTFKPDDEDTAPDEAWEPATPGELSDQAKKAATNVVASYLGADAVKDFEEELLEALAEGKQPCVVEGTGNLRFELKVFPDILHRNDVSKDVSNVVLNVARLLADKNLYPSG